MDWHQLWEIVSAPITSPSSASSSLALPLPRLEQAHANDQLVEQLEGDAALGKRITGKTWPSRRAGKRKFTFWPFLLTHRVPRRHHCDHHPHDLVDHAECFPWRSRRIPT